MTRWPGVYLIGLTGNIATGKSQVRKFLADLGATTIDADELAHETLRRDGLAYAAVVQEFGTEIVREGGDIDRARLGTIVFRDPVRLNRLEELVHPAVHTLIDTRLRAIGSRPELPSDWLHAATGGARKHGRTIVVVEAIRLFESGLAAVSDQVWVTSCPPEEQLQRLMRLRQLSETEARLRIDAQPSQLEKLARADVVIDNAGTLEELRMQVTQAWKKFIESETR